MTASLVVLAGLALCGCTPPGADPAKQAQLASTTYSCRVTDSPGSHHHPRTVTITRDPAQSKLGLALENGRTEILDPVASSSGQLFADAEFAWRVAGDRSVLTDVENIQTYACRPVIVWPAAGSVVTARATTTP